MWQIAQATITGIRPGNHHWHREPRRLRRRAAAFFEEMTPEAVRLQIETTPFGPVNVTRAALPPLCVQRFGVILTISSTAGIASTGAS